MEMTLTSVYKALRLRLNRKILSPINNTKYYFHSHTHEWKWGGRKNTHFSNPYDNNSFSLVFSLYLFFREKNVWRLKKVKLIVCVGKRRCDCNTLESTSVIWEEYTPKSPYLHIYNTTRIDHCKNLFEQNGL
jgi:hypothetical protein